MGSNLRRGRLTFKGADAPLPCHRVRDNAIHLLRRDFRLFHPIGLVFGGRIAFFSEVPTASDAVCCVAIPAQHRAC
jgi:hypothetical protein